VRSAPINWRAGTAAEATTRATKRGTASASTTATSGSRWGSPGSIRPWWSRCWRIRKGSSTAITASRCSATGSSRSTTPRERSVSPPPSPCTTPAWSTVPRRCPPPSGRTRETPRPSRKPMSWCGSSPWTERRRALGTPSPRPRTRRTTWSAWTSSRSTRSRVRSRRTSVSRSTRSTSSDEANWTRHPSRAVRSRKRPRPWPVCTGTRRSPCESKAPRTRSGRRARGVPTPGCSASSRPPNRSGARCRSSGGCGTN